jgi:hypothetical protein
VLEREAILCGEVVCGMIRAAGSNFGTGVSWHSRTETWGRSLPIDSGMYAQVAGDHQALAPTDHPLNQKPQPSRCIASLVLTVPRY